MSPAKHTTLTGKDDWGTPKDLYRRLHEQFAFDYDAFASHDNALCLEYSIVDGTFTRRPAPGIELVNLGVRYNKLDGLGASWAGRRVFMNPPYSREMLGPAMKKASEERNSAAIIVALIPFDPSTKWFQNYVEPFCFIQTLKKRVRFEGADNSAPFPCCVAIYRKELQ